uniref:Pectinesterase inhibitor domain-containing protein n=1 Tax=Oryza meridionalis TaxID=40149 RepID=A0A0E0FA86_9ORYZ
MASLAAGIDSALYGACKTVAGNSGVVSITFCIDTLSSDNRSHDAAGFKDYAVVTVDLITANATSTKSKIDGILQNGGAGDGDAKRRCLQSCQAAYAGVLQAQPGIVADVQGGRRLPEAISALEKSASAVKECENGFGKSNKFLCQREA